MKIYYICECCDRIFKATGPGESARDGSHDLTGVGAGGIMMGEYGHGVSYATGLCEDCREEVYGPPPRLVYPYRLH
jgi:hypothetical protein